MNPPTNHTVERGSRFTRDGLGETSLTCQAKLALSYRSPFSWKRRRTTLEISDSMQQYDSYRTASTQETNRHTNKFVETSPHLAMKSLFCLLAKSRLHFGVNNTDINETIPLCTCRRPCAFEIFKQDETPNELQWPSQHTVNTRAARRSRPCRVRMRPNMFHESAHNHPLL